MKLPKSGVPKTNSGKQRASGSAPVTRETAKPAAKKSAPASRTAVNETSKPAAATRVAGIAISNPAKVLYPDRGITKGELAAYYETIAPWMLPHVAGRPLTLLRCPDGYDGGCFFQKNAGTLPKEVERIEVPDLDGGKASQYGVVRDASGIVALLQAGALEIHVWGSTADHLEQPDRIVFDLDPDVGVSWQRVVEAAHLVRATLAKLGLSSHAMLTGGKGLHVVLHVEPGYDWPIVKEFTHAVVKTIVRNEPDRYTDQLSKKRRQGRIFLDYLRNGRGATAIAPWSTRARPGAPVAVPIDWRELDADLRGDAFNVKNIGARLKRSGGDPWKLDSAAPQSLERALEGAKKQKTAR